MQSLALHDIVQLNETDTLRQNLRVVDYWLSQDTQTLAAE